MAEKRKDARSRAATHTFTVVAPVGMVEAIDALCARMPIRTSRNSLVVYMLQAAIENFDLTAFGAKR